MTEHGIAPEGREINPRTESPSDELRQVLSDVRDAVKASAAANKSAGEFAAEKWAEIKADIEKAQKTNRVLDSGMPTRLTDSFDMEDILTSKPENDYDAKLQKLNDRMMDAKLLQESGHPLFQGPLKETRAFQKFDRHVKLAAGDWWYTGTAGTAQGEEWTPTGYSIQMVDVARLAPKVFASLPVVMIPRGVTKWRVPVKTSRSAWAIHTEQATVSAAVHTASVSNPGTGYIELDPVTHRGETGFSAEMEQDSVLETFGMHRTELVASAAETMDTCALNGQSTALGTLDAGNGPAAANGYGAVGLRWWGIVNEANTVAGGGANVTAALLLANRQALGKFGVVPTDLGHYLDPVNYIALLGSDEVETIDKLGPAATIITGQVGMVHGAPIFVSSEMPTNLAVGGTAFTPGTTTCALTVNRTRWRAGIKQSVQVETYRQPGLNSYRMYGFIRTHIGGAPAAVSADQKHVAVLVNVKRT